MFYFNSQLKRKSSLSHCLMKGAVSCNSHFSSLKKKTLYPYQLLTAPSQKAHYSDGFGVPVVKAHLDWVWGGLKCVQFIPSNFEIVGEHPPPTLKYWGCEWAFEKQTNHAKEHEYMLCLISQLPRWGGKRTKRHQWRPFFNFHRDHSGKTLEKWWRTQS